MPRFPCSLEVCPAVFDSSAGEKLLFQMYQALQSLHSVGLVHCDVKPGNIFVSQNGDFVLGDFGGVRKENERIAQSTDEYIPLDAKNVVYASFAYDHWMLAMTMFDMMSDLPMRLGSGSVRRPTQRAVSKFLMHQLRSEAALKIVQAITAISL
jgi:serine/threonine protein kinase